MMPIKSMSQRVGTKPRTLGSSRDARRLCLEKLDARVVLSANGFVGAMYVGPAIAGDHASAPLSSFSMQAAGSGNARELTPLRTGMASQYRFDGPGAQLWSDSRPGFGIQTSLERFDNSKPSSPGILDLDVTSSQNFAARPGFGLIGRNSYDTFHGFGDTGAGGTSLVMFDRGTQGGPVDLYIVKTQTLGSISAFSQWDRPTPRFLIERIFDSLSSHNDLVASSQAASALANTSSHPAGGGKDNGSASESGTVNIPGRSTGGQITTTQVFVDGGARGSLELAALLASPTTTAATPLGRQDNSVLSSPAAERPLAATAEGGWVDIGANTQSGKLALPKLSLDTDLETASAMDESEVDAKDVEQFWADLGEELESLEPAEFALDAGIADGDDVVGVSDAVALVDQAMAIYNGEGGMVELSVNQIPAATINSSGADVHSTAQVPRQATPNSIEIEMDAAVAMFQAFELETSPKSALPVSNDAAEASNVEATDAAGEKPQPQPVDRASVGPLSILFAIATTVKSERDRNAQPQRQGLGKQRMVR